MKNTIKVILLFIIITAVSFLMPNFINNTNYTEAADGDPFTVIQIVPYKGMDVVGYLVDDEEPIQKELMSIDNAASELAFLNGAISVYPSYEESPLPVSGNPDIGWDWAGTYEYQNGYFEYVGYFNGGYYSRNRNVRRYIRVADGTGDYVTDLGSAQLDDVYSETNPLNRKNVNAWFVYGLSTGLPLYNNTEGYLPYSVTENPAETGDYYYDYDTGTFILNKGAGSYDVLFEHTNNTTNVYYMTDDYEIVEDNSGDYSCDLRYVYQAGGNYDRVRGYEYYYNNYWGTYRWVEDDEALEKPYNYYEDNNNRVWVIGFPIYKQYQYKYNVELLNNEWFKRLTLGIPSSQVDAYPVEVITLTPEELNNPDNQHYIVEGDYFFFNADYNQDPGYIEAYEHYSQEGLDLPYEDKYSDGQNSKQDNLNFAYHDLLWSNVTSLFLRAAGIGFEVAPIIMDSAAYLEALADVDVVNPSPYDFLKKVVAISDAYISKTGTICNVAKLNLMLDRNNLIKFHEDFMDPETTDYYITEVDVDISINTTGKTGSFVRPDADDPTPLADASIYWNEDTFLPIVTEIPKDPIDDGTVGSNYRNYKRVLNIQPTADFTDSETAIRNMLSAYDVQIVNITSIQFNGSVEDINARYDMIYFGNGAGRFNWSGGDTNFNYNNLDDYYYFSTGDYIWNTYYAHDNYYRGNDLTTQKIRELTAFLAAGYPIVLEQSLYQLTTVYNGNFDNFIDARNNGNVSNFLNGNDFLSSNSGTRQTFINRLDAALEITRPRLRFIEPMIRSDEVNYTRVDEDTNLLTIIFDIPLKNLLPSSIVFDGAFFVDMNGDGLFDASEEVKSDGESIWPGIRESSVNRYTYEYDMSGMNGVYKWRVLVKRQDNGEIRSDLTGYAVNTYKKNIKVLQLIDSIDSYSLENKVIDTGSLIFKYANNTALDEYNIIFDTMTVQDFVYLYDNEGNPLGKHYNPMDASSNRLLGYHLLILDNPSVTIDNSDGAFTNIKDEIAKDLSLIFTKNLITGANQSTFYPNTSYNSFQAYNIYTYNHINRITPPSVTSSWSTRNNLYIYNNLASNGNINTDATYQTSFLTKANDGSITRYPYQINKAISIAPNSYSPNATRNMDLINGPKLIGWYCLSDSKSPVVRDEGLATWETTDPIYEGMYSSSPNDVINNYYLFSNGRTFYSGIRLATADQPNNDAEIKLFVNTLIAAFKASNRVVSTPPIITIKDPDPVIDPVDFSQTITITPADIVGTDLIVTFMITDSSSDMDLEILFDGNNDPDGDWNDTIYEVASGVLGDEVIISGTDKNIPNGTYAVIIPVDQLSAVPEAPLTDSHLLKIIAVNQENNSVPCEVYIKIEQMPIVTIVDPVPLGSETPQIIYADIDMSTVGTDMELLIAAGTKDIKFEVDMEIADSESVVLELEVTSGGTTLTDVDPQQVTICKIIDGVVGPPLNITELSTISIGDYVLKIPMTLMADRNNREFTISATDTFGNSGSAAFNLLRRSLFPLD